jgi:hypothetical protein
MSRVSRRCRACGAAVFVWACSAANPSHPERTEPTAYFPPHTFNESIETLTVGWYGKHLRAMKEPSLWAAASRGSTAYRFLWLRTWGRPIAVRVTVNGTGAHLVVTRLSGSGGYEPGDVELRRERDLGRADVQRIESALADADYDTTPAEGEAGMDGAEWIIERAAAGNYRLVERWSPAPTGPSASFRAACEVFLELAGRDVITGDVY